MDSNILVILLICFDIGGIILKIITVKDLGVCVCARARLVNTSKQGFFIIFKVQTTTVFAEDTEVAFIDKTIPGDNAKGEGGFLGCYIKNLLSWSLIIWTHNSGCFHIFTNQ